MRIYLIVVRDSIYTRMYVLCIYIDYIYSHKKTQ